MNLSDALARARALAPALRQRADEAGSLRTLPTQTRHELKRSGLYRIFQPERFDGHELDFVALLKISSELARACGSTGWVFANLAEHHRLNGMRHPRAQEELWADPDATVCAAFPAQATFKRVNGGVELDGTWGFASGIDCSSWCDFTVFLPREAGGTPAHCFAMAPMRDIEVLDDWDSTGLRGTGSKSVRVKRMFVPERRLVSTERCRGDWTEGSAINPGPLYRTPVYALGGKIFSSCAVGIARGAFDATLEDAQGRTGISHARIAELPTAQARLAEADAEIGAAAALLEHDCIEAMDFARREQIPPLERRMAWRRNDAFAAKLCVSAVERLHALAGARRLSANDAFQRHWRDVHAAAAQIQLSMDAQGVNYGRVLLGMQPLDPRV